LADDAFNTLLPSNRTDEFIMEPPIDDLGSNRFTNRQKSNDNLDSIHSDPIQIPDSKPLTQQRSASNLNRLASTDTIPVSQPSAINPINCNKTTTHLSCSPGCSSLDSFVFVDLKPPFAPDDQSELGSFFNGPSPSFGECSLAEEMEDLTAQLALMESNAQQWDQFVDSINLKSEEDEFESE
jgi:hypothetical protein